MNADGSAQTNLTSNTASDFDPVWPPDGQRIAFTSDRDGNLEVYVMNTDGSGPTNLTINAASDFFPAWSPDGEKIAFTSNRDGNIDVFVMNADGSGPTNLTSNAASDFLPAWSPDGQKIAFQSDRDGFGNDEVYVMNADGSAQTRLTSNGAPDQGPDWQPVLAPDPEEELTDLSTLVDSFGLPDGLTTSLQSKLTQALADVEAGDIAAACSELASFLNEVSAQTRKKLTEAQAQQLTEAANELRAELGC